MGILKKWINSDCKWFTSESKSKGVPEKDNGPFMLDLKYIPPPPPLTTEQQFRKELVTNIAYWEDRGRYDFAKMLHEVLCKVEVKEK